MRWILGPPLVFLILVIPAIAQESSTPPVEVQLVKVRNIVEEMDWLDGSSGRGKIEVFFGKTTWYQHRGTSLEKVADGRVAWILARHQERSSGYDSSQSIPAMKIQIQAVVVGPFEPPELTEKQKLAKVQWFRGKLKKSGNKNYSIDDVLMQAGSDRPVLEIRATKLEKLVEGGKKAPLRKGALVQVKGFALPVDRIDPAVRPEKARKKIDAALAAIAVHVLDPRFPKKENEVILGRAK